VSRGPIPSRGTHQFRGLARRDSDAVTRSRGGGCLNRATAWRPQRHSRATLTDGPPSVTLAPVRRGTVIGRRRAAAAGRPGRVRYHMAAPAFFPSRRLPVRRRLQERGRPDLGRVARFDQGQEVGGGHGVAGGARFALSAPLLSRGDSAAERPSQDAGPAGVLWQARRTGPPRPSQWSPSCPGSTMARRRPPHPARPSPPRRYDPAFVKRPPSLAADSPWLW